METKLKVFYLTVLLLGGCVPVATLHPVYTDETIVFEEKLLGTWINDSNETWQFTRIKSDSNGCYLRLKDNEGRKGYFEGHLCKIDESLILDVIPATHPCGEKDAEDMKLMYNLLFIQPLHTFVKIELADPNLTIAMTHEDKFEELLKNSPGSLQFTKAESRLIITASPEQLQKFIAENIDDERLFANPMELKRKETAIEEQTDPNEK